MKKTLLIAFLFGLLTPGIVLSSDGYSGQHHSNAAIKKYVKEHVMPVLQQKRQVLEAELTPEERTTIAECRAALKQLQEQRKEQWSERAQKESAAGEAWDHQGNENFSQYHQQTKEIMEKLDAIAAKHSNTLGNIKTELEPVRKQWKEDIQRLTPQNQDGTTPHYGHGHAGFESYLAGNFHHAAARFLLIPATSTTTSQTTSPGSVYDGSAGVIETNASTDAPASANPVSLSSFGVFPNPASNEIVTSSSAIPAENELTILTMQGATVLALSNVQPSQHMDVSQLAPGNYIVQVKSSTETVNRQLVITR